MKEVEGDVHRQYKKKKKKDCVFDTASYLLHFISVPKHCDARETQSFPLLAVCFTLPCIKTAFSGQY